MFGSSVLNITAKLCPPSIFIAFVLSLRLVHSNRPVVNRTSSKPDHSLLVKCFLYTFLLAGPNLALPMSFEAPAQPTNGILPRRKMVSNNVGLTQAYELRNFACDEAMALRDLPCTSLDQRLSRARALRDLATVWRDASDRIRIIKGKPLPGSKRPPVEQPKKPKAQTFVPPVE